ncbi:MAG TPA: hypothetical protein VFQ61_34620 [Polyangiaceae bacterium]|nr:hypothetical protein [Polyangiaceae bacterium]
MGRLALRRALLVVVAGAALTAVLAGLGRLGISFGWGPKYALAHGPLFVVGVFGTVIALERAVALGRPIALLAPAVAAASAMGLLLGRPESAWLAVLAAVLLVLVNGAIVRRQSAGFTWLMLLGTLLLGAGNLAWACGKPIAAAAPAWLVFFVATISAERLELSRLARAPSWASQALLSLALLSTLLACASALGIPNATRMLGPPLALIGAWQLRFDIARRTVRAAGLPRFSAVGIMSGSLWLCVAGVLLMIVGLPQFGVLYDAVLHAVFVGYALSMVFAHAPIILPAVVGIRVPFSPALYAPLVVLHAGLLARLIGDLGENADLRRLGSIVNALALAVFVLAMSYSRGSARSTHHLVNREAHKL